MLSKASISCCAFFNTLLLNDPARPLSEVMTTKAILFTSLVSVSGRSREIISDFKLLIISNNFEAYGLAFSILS